MSTFFDPGRCRNESEVESKFVVLYLLPMLGYSPECWQQEVTFGKIRLDFLAVAANLFGYQNRLQLILEAKHPRQNLDRHVRKFRRYLTSLEVRYGLLTNGHLVRIYEQSNGELNLLLQVTGREIPQRIETIKQIIGRETLQQEALIQATSPQLHPTNPKQQINQTSSNQESNMKVIAIYHNKGGVGKTTTVINLAAALSKQNKRVLVIDLDSQANTTFATGLVKFQDELTDTIKNSYVYHVIIEKNKFSIADVARQSSFSSPEFDVIPSHIRLMECEQEFVQTEHARTRLVRKLQDVKDRYDIVLIDTPPSLNIYARIALIAADYLIIPSDLKPFANEGLRNVQKFVAEINDFKEEMGRGAIKVLGVLPTKLATYARFIDYTLPKMEAIVQNQYGFPLLKSRIFERRDVSSAIERTIEMGQLDIPDPRSILDHKPDSQSAEEFSQLAQEVLALIDA